MAYLVYWHLRSLVLYVLFDLCVLFGLLASSVSSSLWPLLPLWSFWSFWSPVLFNVSLIPVTSLVSSLSLVYLSL